jgi:DNA-binding LacI/PurR family transcriptional regulator
VPQDFDVVRPPHAPRAGVREVAAAAGVSTQTVSRVLNGAPNIRDETRDRVLDAMRSLDYRVNNAARALGTSETRTIGIIVSDATLFGPSVGVAAIEAAARAEGRWVTTTSADAADDASVLEALEHVRGQGVDGVVLVAPHTRTRQTITERAGDLPVAILHGDRGAEGQRRGAAAVVEHLVDLGHRRIGRLGGPPDWLEEEARSGGAAAAAARLGLQPAPGWVGDWTAASGAGIAKDVAERVRRADGPTAIVVANDQMALGLISGLRMQGIDVPNDVSIAGFDDNPDSAFYRPALTTVRVDVAGEARRCVAEVLASRSAGLTTSASDASGAAEPELVVRASTAAPRA